jgi:predicted esterase
MRASLLFLLFATMVVPFTKVFADTNAAPSIPTPLSAADLAKKRVAMLKDQPLAVASIFSGDTFPTIDFRNRDLVEAAVGPYTLHVRFFDAQWNEVTAPKAPGRYGAVVDCRAPGGLALTRRLTLFKTPRPYFWAKEPYDITLQFPASFGIPDDLATQEHWNIRTGATWALGAAARDDDGMATMLAGLHDIAADPARWRGFSCYFIDCAWWSELGRRLGENQNYPRLTYLPEGYDQSQKAWPLILFLHGSGERGSDLSVLKSRGPQGYINSGHPLPFIVVSPQCPEDEWWDPVRLVRLLDQVCAEKRVDAKRIYVTGLSMGGFGALDLAATYPERIAAIAPLSGGEDPELAGRLRNMPDWLFHGADDNVVPASESIDLAHALQARGAPVKLTIYPGVGHGDWAVTYSNPALYSWLLEQSK